MSDVAQLLCLRVKPNENPEKVRRRILKGLRSAERRGGEAIGSNISHPLLAWEDNLHTFSELNAADVVQVANNSRYVIFLTRDGRVCRIKCRSYDEPSSKFTPESLSRRAGLASFQVQSDAAYARQLQAQFDAERPSSGLAGGLGAASRGRSGPGAASSSYPAPPSLDLQELDRQANEYMILGSIPTPEYEQDPEYFRDLARSLSHQVRPLGCGVQTVRE